MTDITKKPRRLEIQKMCPKCGRMFMRLSHHVRICDRVFTVASLLELGNVDTSVGEDACWMWNRGKMTEGDYGGYGRVRAHVRMYYAATGIDPTGKSVCHSCDRPGCVNPRHLWLGTGSDNTRDAVSKGRVVSPMLNPETVEKVKLSLPRGDDHYTRRNPEIAAQRAESMMIGQRKKANATSVKPAQEVMPHV